MVPYSSPSCARGWACRIVTKMPGAPAAMASSTYIPSTRPLAPPEVNEPSGATPYVICSSIGPAGRACNRSVRRAASFCRSVLKRLARRPADIFLPALSGFPTALDLAVTAPQRQETLARAAQTALSAASSYTQTKATHLNTAAACEQQGVKFVPLVVESTGAWDPSASRVLQVISRATAARLGADAAAMHAELLQDLCVVVRLHRARAILRRRSEFDAST